MRDRPIVAVSEHQHDEVGVMRQTPQISVIVPTRDRPQLLRQALESVRTQDFEAFECIVVDDGSHEFGETARVVCDLHDARFRLIQSRVASTSDAGPGSRFAKGLAVNRGIDEATTEWLAFLDDDDLFAPYRLSRGLESVRSRPGVLVTVARSGAFTTAPPGWPPAPRLRLRRVRNPLARMMPHASTWTLSRSLAYDVGLFRPYGVMEDWEFYSRLWSVAAIWRDDATTVAIRQHDALRNNYGLEARIKMRQDLLRSGVLRPNLASRAFQLYRLSQAESRAGNHLGAVLDALMSLVPVPYPRYVVQAVRAVTRGVLPQP
jgi:glycosyltransferase involved in cell wall biosynthesis